MSESEIVEAGLKGAVAVVTGASSGIGAAVVGALVDAGCRVHGFDLQPPGADAQHRHHAVDVTDDVSVTRAVEEVLEEGAPVRVLVNCAGIIAKQPIEALDFDVWDRVHDVNVKGTIRTIKALRTSLIASGGRGRIVNISSMTAGIGVETYAPYSASKAAVSNITKVFAAELAPFGVTVNALCPGWVATPMVAAGLTAHIAKIHDVTDDEAYEKIMSYVPQRRFIEPREIAHAVVSLAHPLAQAISAEEIRIDGGLTQTFTPGLHVR